MKKILLALTLISFSFSAQAKKDQVGCRAQLARASERLTEILPKDVLFDFKSFDEQDRAYFKFEFSLRNNFKPYVVDVEVTKKDSLKEPSLKAIDVKVSLTDPERNKVLGVSTDSSENMRTSYLRDQFFENERSIVVFDIGNMELLESLGLNEENSGYEWAIAAIRAWEEGKVKSDVANFASVNCEYQN